MTKQDGTMTRYRIYEATRNAAGGLEGLGTGWDHIEAQTAQDAAERAAQERANWPETDGLVVVATDDAGESATADVDDYRD